MVVDVLKCFETKVIIVNIPIIDDFTIQTSNILKKEEPKQIECWDLCQGQRSQRKCQYNTKKHTRNYFLQKLRVKKSIKLSRFLCNVIEISLNVLGLEPRAPIRVPPFGCFMLTDLKSTLNFTVAKQENNSTLPDKCQALSKLKHVFTKEVINQNPCSMTTKYLKVFLLLTCFGKVKLIINSMLNNIT